MVNGCDRLEVWKDIDGYEGLYQVSNLGRVRSLNCYVPRRNRWGGITQMYKNGVILASTRENESRYLTVSLYKNGKRHLKYVHRLVAIAFVENPNEYQEVNHIDEDKLNNEACNLEWCDRTYNANYGKLKNHFRGSKNPSCKLTESDVKEIRELISKGISDLEISEKFNVCRDTIGYIRRGQTWWWVT